MSDKSITELQAEFDAIRASGGIEDVLKAARALDTAIKAEAAAIAKAEREAATAAWEAKMALITGPMQTFTEAVHKAIERVRAQFTEAGVTGLSITVGAMDGDMTVNLKPSGPGVPTRLSGPKAKADGARAPRATLPDGRSWRQVADEAGLDVGASSAHKVVATKAPELHASIEHECGLS